MAPGAGFRHQSPDGRQRGVVLQRLQDVAALTRLVERRLGAALGVNGTDLHAMEHLSTDGALTARELADRLQVSTAAGTHIVDRLERAGHVSRRPHGTDRRKILVEPAVESVAAATEFLRPVLDELEAAVDALSPAERAAVEGFLDAVVEIYTRHTAPSHTAPSHAAPSDTAPSDTHSEQGRRP